MKLVSHKMMGTTNRNTKHTKYSKHTKVFFRDYGVFRVHIFLVGCVIAWRIPTKSIFIRKKSAVKAVFGIEGNFDPDARRRFIVASSERKDAGSSV
jgi:hypothetical protein